MMQADRTSNIPWNIHDVAQFPRRLFNLAFNEIDQYTEGCGRKWG